MFTHETRDIFLLRFLFAAEYIGEGKMLSRSLKHRLSKKKKTRFDSKLSTVAELVPQ